MLFPVYPSLIVILVLKLLLTIRIPSEEQHNEEIPSVKLGRDLMLFPVYASHIFIESLLPLIIFFPS
jgi:hypothetical protein